MCFFSPLILRPRKKFIFTDYPDRLKYSHENKSHKIRIESDE